MHRQTDRLAHVFTRPKKKPSFEVLKSQHNVTTRTGGLAFRCRKRFDGARDLYRAYPLAARIADANGRLPLHRAAAAVALHSGPSSENADGRSVLCSLVEEYTEASSQTDKMGRLPIHAIAECAEVWDEGVEAILNAHPAAPRVRAGPELYNRLAIHMAAANPDARRSLME